MFTMILILFKLVIAVLSFSFIFAISSAEPPQLNKAAFTNITTREGTFQVFTCSIISGAEPVSFTYLLNGKPVTESPPEVKIDTALNAKFSFLTLQHIRRSDAGVYSCVAKNRFGSDSATWTLTVNGNIALNALMCR